MKKEDTKVINLGCRLNFFESEVIKNILNQENLEKKIVINTCAVTNQAVRKSINEVKKASRKFPNYQIYVTGCASQVNEKVFSDLKNVHKIVDDATVGPDMYHMRSRMRLIWPYQPYIKQLR